MTIFSTAFGLGRTNHRYVFISPLFSLLPSESTKILERFSPVYLDYSTNLVHSRSLSLLAVQVYIIKIVRTVARGGQIQLIPT